MDDLKDLLNREAARVPPDAGAFEAVLRRAERRRRHRRAAAGALGVLLAGTIALGSYAGIRALRGPDAPTPAQTPPAAREDMEPAWEGIWPHATLEEATLAQQRADAADPGYLWQLEPPAVAERFVLSRFPDDDRVVSGIRLGERAHGRPVVVRVRVWDPEDLEDVDSLVDALDDPRETLDVTLEQPLRHGSGGIWVVTEYRPLPEEMIEKIEESRRMIRRLQQKLERALERAAQR